MKSLMALAHISHYLPKKHIEFALCIAMVLAFSCCHHCFAESSSNETRGLKPADHSAYGRGIQSGDLYAVVVGISKYRDNRIPALKVSDKDARSVSDFLKTQKGLFKNLNVSLLQNEQATAEALQREFIYGLRKAGKDDTVIIFLSGHGVDDPKSPGEFFFLPYDADPEYVAVRGIHMNRQWFTERLDAKRVLVIADACHSGGFAGSGMKRLPPSLDKFMGQFKQSEGRIFITSSRADEYSRESTEQGHSLFTHYLLDGLSGKAADQAGVVYLQPLYDYVYGMTKKASDGFQSPQMEGRVVGEFPLAMVGGLISKPPQASKISMTFSPESHTALLKKDYDSARQFYAKDVSVAERTGNTADLFRSYTGLAMACEGMKDYAKASEFYEKAVRIVEDVRSNTPLGERENFFSAKTGGFDRLAPINGLNRTEIMLGQTHRGIYASELSKARTLSDHLAHRFSDQDSAIPERLRQTEQSLIHKRASLEKQVVEIDKDLQPWKYDQVSAELAQINNQVEKLAEDLWENYPLYVVKKYSRPVPLGFSALRPDECVIIFDLLEEGVGIRLIHEKKIKKSFWIEINQNDLEKEVTRFLESFSLAHGKLPQFHADLAGALYKKLLHHALTGVPEGNSIIIIPDGILNRLPFEALVVEGTPKWERGRSGLLDPKGLTFVGDKYPVSYCNSITSLALVRKTGQKRALGSDTMLVIADPIFDRQDKRLKTGATRLIRLVATSEEEKNYGLHFLRLARTGVLAENLCKMCGHGCLKLTGVGASKTDFINKIGPRISEFRNIVFATHAVVGGTWPGVDEPSLALSMVPRGSDGFLKMSEIKALKMNAEIAAIIAGDSASGRFVLGEGVISVARAFQYAGAKSVLASLWMVDESSAVMLAEGFFRNIRAGMTKSKALQEARQGIRSQGYDHPFFWAAFVIFGDST